MSLNSIMVLLLELIIHLFFNEIDSKIQNLIKLSLERLY